MSGEILELPKTHPLTAMLESQMRELSSLSVDQLREELSKALELTAKMIARLACIVRILEERGEDLSDMRFRLIAYLRQVAYGQVLPEAVFRFQANPQILNRIAILPPPEQAKALAADGVTVAEFAADGTLTHRRLAIEQLTREQVVQIFSKEGIRSLDDQAVWLKNYKKKTFNPEKRKGVHLDREKGGVFVNGEFLSRSRLAQILADLTT